MQVKLFLLKIFSVYECFPDFRHSSQKRNVWNCYEGLIWVALARSSVQKVKFPEIRQELDFQNNNKFMSTVFQFYFVEKTTVPILLSFNSTPSMCKNLNKENYLCVRRAVKIRSPLRVRFLLTLGGKSKKLWLY